MGPQAPTEETQLYLFLEGLKLEVMKEVLLQNPKKLKDAIFIATRTDTVVHSIAKNGNSS